MTTTVQLGELILSAKDTQGADWRTVAPIDGWDSSPGSTITTTQKPRQPGAWATGPRELTQRLVTLSGLVSAASEDDVEQALDRLRSAASLAGTTLSVTRGTNPRTATVYRQGELTVTEVTGTLYQWQIALVAPDPRKYGATITATTGLPSKSGGMTWPVKWPLTWTGVYTSGIVSVDNPGNIQSPLTLRIDGPVTGPIIRHVSKGVELSLSSNYTVPAGSYLLIDTEARTILEGGTASRNGSLISRGWFNLDPGANDLIFDAAVRNTQAKLTVTAKPAYL